MTGLHVLRAAIATVVLVATSGCTAPTAPSDEVTSAATVTVTVTDTVAPIAAPTTDPTTFDAIGDSITSWEGLELSGAPRTDTSWTTAVGNKATLEGGWARGGAETQQMVDTSAQLTLDADVLVLLGGTNDINHGIPEATTLSNINTIAASAKQRGQCVVLVAVPPNDTNTDATKHLNVAIAELADNHQWVFVDPWTAWDVDGQWTPGASTDGVHPARPIADKVGESLGSAITTCTSRPQQPPTSLIPR